MADVVVTVNIDGKQAYVHGAGGAADANAFAAAALQAAADHFKSVASAGQKLLSGPAKSQDNSL